MVADKKVFVTRNIPLVIEKLKTKNLLIEYYNKIESSIPRSELLNGVNGSTGIFCLLTEKIDKELLDAAGPSLKIVSTMSVGFNHIDIEECKRRGIQVGYTPGVLTVSTAELAVGLTFSVARCIVECANMAKKGEWGVWNPYQYCGTDISQKTVGIIGLGRIGTTYARMMKAFDCNLLYTGPQEKEEAKALNARFCSFDELLKKSDIVSVHCPLNSYTNKLFNQSAFTKMKKTAIFINTSRGPLVDQDALFDALKNKEIAGAGLDVTDPEPLLPDHPLFSIPNCVILPHIGSATIATREKMANLALENLLAGVEGRELQTKVI